MMVWFQILEVLQVQQLFIPIIEEGVKEVNIFLGLFAITFINLNCK